MRILQVAPGYYPDLGGVEHHVQLISETLADKGHEVAVATMLRKKGLPKVERVGKIVVRRFQAIGPVAYRIPLGMYQYLRRDGPNFDVIHAHNYGAIPLLLAVLVGGRRTVITPHYHGRGRSRLADLMHKIYDPIAVPILTRAGGFVSVSAGEADDVVRRLGIARDHIVVIPNAIKLSKQDYDQPAGNRKENLILSVGRLEAYKRVDRVIATIPHLSKEFTLVVIGLGPERVPLEHFANTLGVGERIRFVDYVSDGELLKWYARSKVVVSLSEGEAFGRIVVEALASGCNVICSDIPAFRDFSAKFPGDVSLISSMASEKEIAEAIHSAAAKPSPSVDLECYAETEIVRHLLKVYYAVASKIE